MDGTEAHGSRVATATRRSHAMDRGLMTECGGRQLSSVAQGADQPVGQRLVFSPPNHLQRAAPLEAAPREGRPCPPQGPAHPEAARARLVYDISLSILSLSV